MKPDSLFYIEREGQQVAGPYDLVQMAGLLRRKIITPETPTRREGEDAWRPFSWQPEFMVAREMSPDAVSSRIEALDEEAAARASGPIPLPSAETLLRVAGMIVGSLAAGVGAYCLARLDFTMGYCLEAIGGGAALLAYCMIMVQLADEDYKTLLFVFFVPFGDLFYFVANFWKYLPWFCLKYAGAAVWIGAVAGLAAHGAR